MSGHVPVPMPGQQPGPDAIVCADCRVASATSQSTLCGECLAREGRNATPCDHDRLLTVLRRSPYWSERVWLPVSRLAIRLAHRNGVCRLSPSATEMT